MRGTALRRRAARPATLVVAALLAGACAHGDAQDLRPARSGGVRLTPVATGLDKPVHVTAPSGDPRLFVVEQDGLVRIVRDGRVQERPFLDLRGEVSRGYERGLLSLAFHPRFAENGFFFVDYTDRDGDTRIERWSIGDDPDRADPGSRRLVLRIGQPYSNHNGGHLLFGPDGMLYVPTGDGGSGGDPRGNGQNPGTLLGKILRLDVDRGDPYAIPPDNPFVDRPGARPEIWALGLRNPWRVAFDPAANLLFVADVGQDRWEEISVVPADSAGINFGWNVMEGRHCYRGRGCDPSGFVLPVVEYPHGDGCSVTGGEVYRGRRVPALAGFYLYADFCRGWIRGFRFVDGAIREPVEWPLPALEVSSFGHDGSGELLVVDHAGAVYRFEADDDGD